MTSRVILVALAIATILGIAPAAAQYYPAPPVYREYREPPRHVRPAPRYEYDRYGRRVYRPAPRRYSDVCVTARGNCSTGRPVPSGTPCACNVPGFGIKRGQVP